MKAAIFYKTEDHIDCDKTNIREQIEDIFDDPSNLQFKEYSDEHDMFALIHEALGKPTVGVTACNIWENKNTVYAGYFIDITEMIDHSSIKDDSEEKMVKAIEEAHKRVKLNLFGSQVTSQHVTGNLVVIKKTLSYTVEKNNIKTNTKPDTLTRNELMDIFENVFVKNGIAVSSEGDMKTYQYIMNPMEHLMLTDSKYAEHYVYHEYEVYTHVMMIIVDTREVNGKRNKIGSLLAGRPVNGTVFVAMYKKPDFNEHPPYVSLGMERLILILALRSRSPSLTTGMSNSEREYVNFDKLLELENVKHSDKPLLDISELSGALLNLEIQPDEQKQVEMDR